jgi:hypothetical protein
VDASASLEDAEAASSALRPSQLPSSMSSLSSMARRRDSSYDRFEGWYSSMGAAPARPPLPPLPPPVVAPSTGPAIAGRVPQHSRT